jgi:PAS domain S-box-containing protein
MSMIRENHPADCISVAALNSGEVSAALLRELMFDTGDSVLLAEPSLAIVEANARASEIHRLACDELIGRDCRLLFAEASRPMVDRAFQEIQDRESWVGELRCVRGQSELFPADVTIKRLNLQNRRLFGVVIRDLSEYETLRQLLQQEKSHRREMYITLRNLMKAFEKEKKGLEGGIAHTIEAVLLPAIEKIKHESSPEIRESYLNILREQLIHLTKGFARELDGRFLRLSRSEIRVCRLIQDGLSSKEIAEAISVSFETIQTHRRNIRKKLGLKGRKVNLYATLSTKPLFQSAATR